MGRIPTATPIIVVVAVNGGASGRGAIDRAPIDPAIDAGNAHRRERSANARLSRIKRQRRRLREGPIKGDRATQQPCGNNETECAELSHDRYSSTPSVAKVKSFARQDFDFGQTEFHRSATAKHSFGVMAGLSLAVDTFAPFQRRKKHKRANRCGKTGLHRRAGRLPAACRFASRIAIRRASSTSRTTSTCSTA